MKNIPDEREKTEGVSECQSTQGSALAIRKVELTLQHLRAVLIGLGIRAGPRKQMFWIVFLLQIEEDCSSFEDAESILVWVFEDGDSTIGVHGKEFGFLAGKRESKGVDRVKALFKPLQWQLRPSYSPSAHSWRERPAYIQSQRKIRTKRDQDFVSAAWLSVSVSRTRSTHSGFEL